MKRIEVSRDHKVVRTPEDQEGENRLRFAKRSDDDWPSTRFVSAVQRSMQDNNAASAGVSTGKPRVLLVESDPNGEPLSWALDRKAFSRRPAAEGMRHARRFAKTTNSCCSQRAGPHRSIQRQMQVARTTSKTRRGLIMRAAISRLAWAATTNVIEEILPVRSDLKGKEKPSLRLLSSTNPARMAPEEAAKDAAKGAVELLGPNDRLASSL